MRVYKSSFILGWDSFEIRLKNYKNFDMDHVQTPKKDLMSVKSISLSLTLQIINTSF